MEKKNNFALFTDTKPLFLFFAVATPGAISMLASSLYSLLDGVFVGRILGQDAFASLNLAMPFVIINFALADLIGVGSSVPIAIQLGKKDHSLAENIFTCAVLMIFTLGILVGAVLFALAPSLMKLMGAEGSLAEDAVSYLRVYALCSPVTTIVFAVDNYLKICGRVKFSMFLNIFMSVFGAVLEFVFLFVFRWGIAAAAGATCCAMITCAIIALTPFAFGKMQLKFCRPKFSLSLVKRIISAGVPTFLSNVAGRITSIVMNTVLLRLGGANAVSIYGMLMYAESFVLPLIYGTCDSLQPAVGYNYGAGKIGRVRSIERCCFTAAAVISLTAAAMFFFFSEGISALFIADMTDSFKNEANFALMIFSATFITRWFSFATQSYMLALEKSAYATAISVSMAFIFPLILMAAFYPLGLTGIWMIFPVTSLLTGILAFWVFLKNGKELRKF